MSYLNRWAFCRRISEIVYSDNLQIGRMTLDSSPDHLPSDTPEAVDTDASRHTLPPRLMPSQAGAGDRQAIIRAQELVTRGMRRSQTTTVKGMNDPRARARANVCHSVPKCVIS